MSIRASLQGAPPLALAAFASTLGWAQTAPPMLSSNATVYATGLNNPRGLTFGPDGELYVAEGGTGGTSSTIGLCAQVPGPVGPYTGGFTSRISRIDSMGTRTTVLDWFDLRNGIYRFGLRKIKEKP